MSESAYGTNPISIPRLFDKAMEAFKANMAVLLVVSVGYAILTSAIGASTRGVAMLLVYGPLTAGYYWLALRAVRGERAEFADVLAPFQRDPVQTIILGALLLIFYAIGFVLCIIPGFVAVLFYMLAFFYFVDRRTSAWNAMEASRTAISRDWTSWLVLMLVVIAVNIVGLLLCGIVLVITKPFTLLMVAAAYDSIEPAGFVAEYEETGAPPEV